jgi:hypothetical protein
MTIMKACLAAIALIGLAAWGITMAAQARMHTTVCYAWQPVYASDSFRQTGTWQAWLLPGQSVLLPDGDTLSCDYGTLVVS